MSGTKYIGMDVHISSLVVAVMDERGKVVMESILETKAPAILAFIRSVPGSLHVTLEEGAYSTWLYDLLLPHVAKVVVCDPRKNALLKVGNKNDKVDARKLAELLRGGMLSPVYHARRTSLRTLQELARSYRALTKDTTRVMSRLKAVYRGWGIACGGQQVYAPRHREAWLERLREAGVRRRAEQLYEQFDFLRALHRRVRRELLVESRKHPASEWLRLPSLGSPSSGSAHRLDADAASFPQQATTVGLQWSGSGNAQQRRVLFRGRPSAAFQESAVPPRSQRQSQSRPEKYLQERGHGGQRPLRTMARFLRQLVGQRDEARDGPSHPSAQDRCDHLGTLEERRTFRRDPTETASSLSVSTESRRSPRKTYMLGSLPDRFP